MLWYHKNKIFLILYIVSLSYSIYINVCMSVITIAMLMLSECFAMSRM